jgi:hypothetical protein
MKMNVINGFIIIFVTALFAQTYGVDRSHLFQNKDSRNEVHLEEFSSAQADAFLKETSNYLFINNFGVEFNFIHKPSASNSQIIYKGFLFGIQEKSGVWKRLVLVGESDALLCDYIFFSGEKSSAWKLNEETSTFDSLSHEEMNESIVDSILFRPVDILMPYLRWDHYEYLGPSRMSLNSIVQKFSFTKSEAGLMSVGVADQVELSIDSKFRAIRKISYLKDSTIEKELSVAGFKKIKDAWFVSRLNFKDVDSKETTVLKIIRPIEESEKLDLKFFDPILRKTLNLNLLIKKSTLLE